VAATRCVP